MGSPSGWSTCAPCGRRRAASTTSWTARAPGPATASSRSCSPDSGPRKMSGAGAPAPDNPCYNEPMSNHPFPTTRVVCKNTIAGMPDEPAPAGGGEAVAAGLTLTAGELIAHLAKYPADTPVTVRVPDCTYDAGYELNEWLNVKAATDPEETGEQSVILCTADDFDTRQ